MYPVLGGHGSGDAGGFFIAVCMSVCRQHCNPKKRNPLAGKPPQYQFSVHIIQSRRFLFHGGAATRVVGMDGWMDGMGKYSGDATAG